jgi:hypothetical protein
MRVHRIVHRLPAKLMICAFVLKVVGAGEACLVSHPFAGACQTVVPILDIKSAGETHILVCPLFHHIGAARILLLGVLNVGKDVWNHLTSTYKGDQCSWLHGIMWVETSTSVAGAVTTSTAASTWLTPLLSWG